MPRFLSMFSFEYMVHLEGSPDAIYLKCRTLRALGSIPFDKEFPMARLHISKRVVTFHLSDSDPEPATTPFCLDSDPSVFLFSDLLLALTRTSYGSGEVPRIEFTGCILLKSVGGMCVGEDIQVANFDTAHPSITLTKFFGGEDVGPLAMTVGPTEIERAETSEAAGVRREARRVQVGHKGNPDQVHS